jgi:hypothetical protein
MASSESVNVGYSTHCFICYESDPSPIQSGCACRDDGGLAHVDCLAQVAISRCGAQAAPAAGAPSASCAAGAPASELSHRGDGWAAWRQCQTCKQAFTGAMQMGLAEILWSRMRDEPQESSQRRGAAFHLAVALSGKGMHAKAEQIKAERIFREAHAIESRVRGSEHPGTLTIAGNLALCLLGQGQNENAEHILREVHAVEMRLLGPEHPDTLSTASNLATSLDRQRKHAQSEPINCEVHAMRVRVLGREHPDTLTSAGNLAQNLECQGKHEKAEQIQREVHGIEMRVLGPEHPNTLLSAENLAKCLYRQGKHAKAEQMIR